jgi:hypothetical protein
MAVDTKVLLEELRSAKERQWAVAIATITFIAGAFHMAHTLDDKVPLRHWEQVAATILVSIVGLGGVRMLYKLQGHLHATRLRIDPNDEHAWKRGLEVVRGLMCILIISAIAVCYSFWRA